MNPKLINDFRKSRQYHKSRQPAIPNCHTSFELHLTSPEYAAPSKKMKGPTVVSSQGTWANQPSRNLPIIAPPLRWQFISSVPTQPCYGVSKVKNITENSMSHGFFILPGKLNKITGGNIIRALFFRNEIYLCIWWSDLKPPSSPMVFGCVWCLHRDVVESSKRWCSSSTIVLVS